MEFCSGELLYLPSCWWEVEGRRYVQSIIKMRQFVTFKRWCLENGLTNSLGEWLFSLPQDWVFDGKEWVLVKEEDYEVRRDRLLSTLRESVNSTDAEHEVDELRRIV
jgi:hypothetical protein